MVLDGSDTFGVVAQRFVGCSGEVEVHPQQALIEGTDEQVIPAGVYRKRGYPSRTRHKRFQQLLFREVVDANAALCGDEEDWFGGVELGCLGEAFEATEETEGATDATDEAADETAAWLEAADDA